jgi:hypothetical protein
VIDNPPLPVGRWWTLERLGDGRPFMWAGPSAELWLPPSPAGTLVGLELRPAPGADPLVVEISHGGGRFELDGEAPATRLWARTTADTPAEPIVVRLDRAAGYPPGGGDERPLAAQLLDVVVRPPGAAWTGGSATAAERAGLRLEVEGAYDPELFPGLGRGVWLRPEARLQLEVDEPGTVTLRLAAPRPTPARPALLRDGAVVAGPVDLDQRAAAMVAEIRADDVARGVVELGVVSEPYRPSADGGADGRELGVVLLGVSFEPERPSAGWWSLPGDR